MNVEIPADLQPKIQAAIVKGNFADEQELVAEILRVVMPVLGDYEQLRRDVQASLAEMEHGDVRDADFDAVRQKLSKEFDESGNPT